MNDDRSMQAVLAYRGRRLRVDFGRGRPIAVPLDPHGPQPRFFTDSSATAAPLQVGAFIGDMEAGGSCNAEVVGFAPHCHGTHTEGPGHVLPDRRPVQDCIDTRPCLARLLTLEAGTDNGELLFALNTLEEALESAQQDEFGALPQALILRRAAADPERGRRDYTAAGSYAVLAEDAMRWLAGRPLRHLLVDAPSLDPARDGGRLRNHKLWWGLEEPEAAGVPEPGARSVTEMVWAPPELEDGCYWLHLELSPLVGDATPSRPMLYPVAPAP